MSKQNKHFLNSPTSLVLDSLRGLCAVNPRLLLDEQNKTVYLATHGRSKVALLCGGGSGHEPAHAGFVGQGILTAAVCGNVFASPNASQVRRGIELVDNDKGTLIIVKNYTGDVLNFGLAKEQYAALHPEKANSVKFLVVGDDVAVGRTQGSIVGRRGLAGTVLVYKIAGALAERGADLDEVYNVAEWVASNVVTIGVGLEHCHVPGTAPTSSYLQDSEIEIGMGIHNESGNRRLSPIPPLHELIPQLLELLISTSDPERSFLRFQGGGNDEVVLLVNNLGGLSELELGGVVREVHQALLSKGVFVHRILSGSFMTSLNMPGFSITLLLLPPTSDTTRALKTSDLLSLLDEDSDAPGWRWSSRVSPATEAKVTSEALQTTATKAPTIRLKVSDSRSFKASIVKACNALIAAEPEITKMDTIAGDGDCGLTLKAGAQAVLKKVSEGNIDGADLVNGIITIGQVAEEAMGGTSGALYSIFFSALAQGLQSFPPNDSSASVTPQTWSSALSFALTKLYTYTRARPPSRTLVDPLAAFINTLAKNAGGDLAEAVSAAVVAAERTKDIEAKVGRSAYVERDRLRKQRVADPGAWGVQTILNSLV